MTLDAESLKEQIPYYLTAAPEQKRLLKELDGLLKGALTGYFLNEEDKRFSEEALQGDGAKGLKIYSFKTQTEHAIFGIVLSNSCDISPDNPRDMPAKVTFAPLLRLSKLEERLRVAGLSAESIKGKTDAMKAQRVTNVFYLPAEGPLDEDHIALLDDLHSIPIQEDLVSQKVFTLSMAGFYLFVFKLSIHFCRLQENVPRLVPTI